MAGYSQMNQGYGEEPGVNWGKVAAYTGGGLVGAGAARMALHRIGGTNAYGKSIKGIKGGHSWVKNKIGGIGGWNGLKQGAANVLGTDQLKRARGAWAPFVAQNKSIVGRVMNRTHNKRGVLETPEMKKEVLGRHTRAAGRKMRRHIGKNVLSYLGGSGYEGQGMKRFGVGVARYGAAMTTIGLGAKLAINALDFLNPFGFGSIDD